MNKRTVVLFAAVLSLSAWTGQAAGPVFSDNFDGYNVGLTFVSPTNGWQASGSSVIVTNDQRKSLPNSVLLPQQTALTNTVNGGSDKVIWTDCYLKPELGDIQSDLPLDTASLVAYFNPSGYVQVVTASGWITCSNDVWGGTIPPAGTDFVRVSIYQNYSASNAALFVNGRLAVQDMRFLGSANAYNTFSVRNTSSNAWLDNVWIKTNYDAATLTNDFNANGVADAAELASYGYAARTQYVGGGYGSFADALNIWRPRDTVYVLSGSYNEPLLVSNSITFAGGVFTNSGILTIKAGVSPVFQKRMTWGSVNLDTNSAVTFSQALECSNLVVRAGATVTFQAVTCSNLIVETGATLTCLGAFVCANICSFDQSATAVFSNTVTCPGAVSVASAASVTLGQGATLGSLACTGSVNVAAGKALNVFSAIVPGVVTVSSGGTATVVTALSLPVGGHLDFTQSRFLYSPLAVDMSGTFSISNNWGVGGSVSVSANANSTFNQPLSCNALAINTGATSTFQAVTCTNLTAEDNVRLIFLSALQCVSNAVIGQNAVAGFSNTVTCGSSLSVGTNSMATFSQALSCSSLVVRAGATVICQSLICSNLVVEPGAHFTCLGAFQCGSTCSIGANATVTFAGTVSCPGGFTVAAGATVNLNQGATLGSLDAAGTVLVGAGKTLTVNTATVSGTVQVTSAGTVTVTTSLSVSAGGTLTFTSSRLYAPLSNVDMNGTFTVNNTWGQASASKPLPFLENFEPYLAGAPIANLGFTGWGATDPGVVIQSAVANPAFGGTKGLSVPMSTIVSNRISTGVQKIWTDCYLMPHLGKEPINPPTNTAGFVAFVNTNGWLEIATSNGWDVCSNLVSGGQADPMTTSSWTRVSVYQNLTNNSVAVFINGKLVRQLMSAPGTPLAAYTSFSMNNLDGQAYLDDVTIKETWPQTITEDIDLDRTSDAYEVDQLGSVTAQNDWPNGTIYLIR